MASSEFSKYGKIEPLGMEFAMVNNALSSIRQREVYKQRMTHLFFSRRTNTIIDVIYGSAVLAVGTSLEELHLFLLDTTVMIHKNVYFYVLPLLSKAVISMSGWGSDYETVPLPSSQSYLTLHPPLYIRDFFSAGLLERPEGSATAPEKGRSFTLFYLLEGGGTMQIDEKKVRLYRDDVLLLLPGQSFSFFSASPSHCALVHFDMDYGETELFSCCKISGDSELRRLFLRLLQEKENESLHFTDYILCLIQEIMIVLIRSRKMEHYLWGGDKRVKHSVELDIIQRVRSYIRKNIHQKITVADIAKSIPVNASYLSTLFKKNTGLRLVEYITEEKLSYAQDLLQEGKWTVSQVSDMLSFSSVHYFSALFKKHFGMPPGAYLRQGKQPSL